jgi:hypothetical protein
MIWINNWNLSFIYISALQTFIFQMLTFWMTVCDSNTHRFSRFKKIMREKVLKNVSLKKKLNRLGLSDFTKCAHGINTILTFLLWEAFQKFPVWWWQYSGLWSDQTLEEKFISAVCSRYSFWTHMFGLCWHICCCGCIVGLSSTIAYTWLVQFSMTMYQLH